jgi:hypothetical protein
VDVLDPKFYGSSAATDFSTIAQAQLIYLYRGVMESSTGRVVELKLSQHKRFCMFCSGLLGRVGPTM